MKRTTAPLLILCAAAGCTAANPDYVPPDGAVGVQRDLAIGMHPPDLTMAMQQPDFATPPECQGDQRSCTADFSASELCANNMFQVDRTCPTDSVCMGGYCAVPPQMDVEGTPCNSETECASQSNLADSCQPFIDASSGQPQPGWFCAPTVGDGASGAQCQDGSTCRSGFCIAATGTCFRACTGDFDCPVHNAVKTVCRDETITVEGVTVTAMSCVNP